VLKYTRSWTVGLGPTQVIAWKIPAKIRWMKEKLLRTVERGYLELASSLTQNKTSNKQITWHLHNLKVWKWFYLSWNLSSQLIVVETTVQRMNQLCNCHEALLADLRVMRKIMQDSNINLWGLQNIKVYLKWLLEIRFFRILLAWQSKESKESYFQ